MGSLPYKPVSLEDLVALRDLVKTQSFRKVTRDMGVAPSTLSRRIAGLEQQMDAQLFDRNSRQVLPTSSGLFLGEVADRILNTYDRGLEEFSVYRSVGAGTLTIAGLPSMTTSIFPSILTTFRQTHPGLRYNIIDVLSGGVVHAVTNGSADIGLAADTATVRSRLSFFRLTNEPFYAVGSVHGPLAEDRAYTWAELSDMPFIAMAQGTSVREILNGEFTRVGIVPNIRMEVSYLPSIGALLSANHGVSVLPQTAVALLPPGLATRAIKGRKFHRRQGLLWRTGRTLSPIGQAFLDHVRTSRIDQLVKLTSQNP